jgi:hypothetical protein
MVGWNVVGESFGAQFDVYRLDPGEDMPGHIVAADISPSGTPGGGFVHYRYTDRDVLPGETYRYYVEGHFMLTFDGEEQYFNPKSDTFKQTAMYDIPAGSIISNASPNPFRNVVKVSIDIPESYEEIPVGDPTGGSSHYLKRKATDIEVSVYDVRGRRVKTLHRGKEFQDIITLSWDGTNTNNRRVPSGVYFIRARAGGLIGVQKILLIR